MSLINDVLQQLDARVPVRPSEKVFVEVLPQPESGVLRFLVSEKIKFFLVVCCGFLTGFYLLSFFRSVDIGIFSSAVGQLTSVSVPETRAPVIDHFENTNDAQELSLTGTLTTFDPSAQPIEPAQPIEYAETLVLAKQHLSADRLTYPPLNNAYQLYREVLLKEPNNEEALAGVEAIKKRYFTLTQEAMSLGEREKAQRYIERAEFVGVNTAELGQLHVQLQALMAQESVASSQDNVSNRSDRVSGSQEIGGDFSGIESSPPVTIDLTASINPAVINYERTSTQETTAVNNAFLSRPNLAKSDEQTFIRILDTQVNSESLALNFIKTHPDASDTVRWLAKRLQRSQAWLQLLDLMNLPSSLGAPERDTFRAQSLLGLKRYEDVIGWLGGLKGLDTPELQRILAVAWQQTGRQAQAFTLYQQLVKRFPDNSGLWLAFAISADAMGNVSAAQEGFFRAQQLGGHSKAVGEFINRKLNAHTL